jgi:hypothetical protein
MPSKQDARLQGFDPDPRVTVDKRVWFGAKLALWRSKYFWDATFKQAAEIVARCQHMAGCPAETEPETFRAALLQAAKRQVNDDAQPLRLALPEEIEPCLDDCPDREFRLSALVILNAARLFAPPSAARLAEQPYMMPSREWVAEIVAELAACQAELEVLRADATTIPPPSGAPVKMLPTEPATTATTTKELSE